MYVEVVGWHLDEVSGGAPLDERDGLLAALALVPIYVDALIAPLDASRLFLDTVEDRAAVAQIPTRLPSRER